MAHPQRAPLESLATLRLAFDQTGRAAVSFRMEGALIHLSLVAPKDRVTCQPLGHVELRAQVHHGTRAITGDMLRRWALQLGMTALGEPEHRMLLWIIRGTIAPNERTA